MPRRLHRLEIRPFRGTRVHAGAFMRMVDTIATLDGVPRDEAADRALTALDQGKFALKIHHGHAAYLATKE